MHRGGHHMADGESSSLIGHALGTAHSLTDPSFVVSQKKLTCNKSRSTKRQIVFCAMASFQRKFIQCCVPDAWWRSSQQPVLHPGTTVWLRGVVCPGRRGRVPFWAVDEAWCNIVGRAWWWAVHIIGSCTPDWHLLVGDTSSSLLFFGCVFRHGAYLWSCWTIATLVQLSSDFIIFLVYQRIL